MNARISQGPGDQFDATVVAVEPHFPKQHSGPVGEVCATVNFFQRSRGLVRCSHGGILCPVFRQAEPLGHRGGSVRTVCKWPVGLGHKNTKALLDASAYPFKATFRVFGRWRIGEAPMCGDGVWYGQCRAMVRLGGITKCDNHIPLLMLNRINAFAGEVIVGNAMLFERGQSHRVRFPGGAASSRAGLQLSREEVRGQGLGHQAPGAVSSANKQQAQGGHVCHCA